MREPGDGPINVKAFWITMPFYVAFILWALSQ